MSTTFHGARPTPIKNLGDALRHRLTGANCWFGVHELCGEEVDYIWPTGEKAATWTGVIGPCQCVCHSEENRHTRFPEGAEL